MGKSSLTIAGARVFEGGNIRSDPTLEPMGIVGDVAWYTARAFVEYSSDHSEIAHCYSHHQKVDNGAIMNSHSVVTFENGMVLSSSVGYSGSFEQTLQIRGEKGTGE